MSFYLPATSQIKEEVVQLGAYTSLDIQALYRDNSDTVPELNRLPVTSCALI